MNKQKKPTPTTDEAKGGRSTRFLDDDLISEGPIRPRYTVSRSRRSGLLVVRDGGRIHSRLSFADLDQVLDEMGGRSLSNDEAVLFDTLIAASVGFAGPRVRGVHAARQRVAFVERLKWLAAWYYVWLMEQRRRNTTAYRRLLTRLAKNSNWEYWYENERLYAITAYAVRRVFPGGDWDRFGLADPTRPYPGQGGATQAEAFYRTYIRPHLAKVKGLARLNPDLLRRAQSAHLRVVLLAGRREKRARKQA